MISGQRFIIATGLRPKILDIPGSEHVISRYVCVRVRIDLWELELNCWSCDTANVLLVILPNLCSIIGGTNTMGRWA